MGHVTSGVWSPTAKRNIALAELKAPYGKSIPKELWVRSVDGYQSLGLPGILTPILIANL